MKQIMRLALADMRHEWRLSLCFISAICAVLVPLLILLGLKTGIINVLESRFLSSPRALELVVNKHASLDAGWFEMMRNDPDVSFVAPSLFSAGGSMDIVNPVAGRIEESVNIIITAQNDPLMGKGQAPPANAHEIVISHRLASELSIQVGDSVIAQISRRFNGAREVAQHPMQVTGIIAQRNYAPMAGFVHESLVIAAQSYKQQQQVPLFNVTEGAAFTPLFPPYPRARFYATTLDGVIRLWERVSASGVNLKSNQDEVLRLQSIRTMLDALFTVIIILAMIGVMLSLASNLWANIDRKREQLAVLQLIGMRKRYAAIFPIFQAVIIIMISMVVSLVCYYVSTWWIAPLFSDMLRGDEASMILQPLHVATVAVTLLCVACIAASLGAYRATTIEPAEAIRGAL